jgi:hypothetical protein
MRRKSSTPAIDTLRLSHVLRLDFSAVVIDDDEMQTRRFKKSRELLHPRTLRSVFGLGDDAVRDTGAHREFALAQVGNGSRGPHVPVGREVAHKGSVAVRRARKALPKSAGTYRTSLVDSHGIALADALLCSRSRTEQSIERRVP